MAKINGHNLTSSIVIPSYNTRELLKKNLPKVIEAMKYKSNNIVEVIVVDDASQDNSYELVKKEFKSIKIVRHKDNKGFSSAVNTGSKKTKGEIIVLLNSDVIPDKDFMVSVQKIFKDEKVFSVTFHERGYSWAKGKFENGFVEHKQGSYLNKIHETFWASGGSAAFRRLYWEKLGGMDEKIFSPFYWEDIDLSYRAAKRGYINLWDPKAMVNHKHESTISQLSKKYVNRIRERNQLLFIWKNITSPALIRKHIIGLSKRVLKHPGYLRVVFMALAHIFVVLKARRRQIKESRVSDEAIFARFS